MGMTALMVMVSNPKNGGRGAQVECIVDTGASYSVIQKSLLKKLRIKEEDTITLSLADGRHVKRKIGEARFGAAGKRATSKVIFGAAGDSNLLGVVALEEMGLFLDPLKRELRPLKIMIACLHRVTSR